MLRAVNRTDPERPLYFQIGYRKCGTTALAHFFERNGIPAVHWDKGRLARRMRDNLAAGRPVLEGYDDAFDAFTDMECNGPDDWFEGFRCFPEMLRDYPGARFVLNTRDEAAWLRSMRIWARRQRRMDYVRARYGSTDLDAFAAALARERAEHHRAVRAAVPPERLLVFDIERDPPERLARFCGLPPPAGARFTRENATRSAAVHWLARTSRRAARRARRLAAAASRPLRDMLS